MKTPSSRKPKKQPVWPRKVQFGRVSVTIYRRQTPSGGTAFMLANYASGKRRFDSYATEVEAMDAAQLLAQKLSARDVVAAAMTNEQAADYAAAVQTLAPYKLSLPAVASTVAECLKLVGGLADIHAAVTFFSARHKRTTAKPVAEVVVELLTVKKSRGASIRYIKDLRSRLTQFANAFQKDACDVTTAEVQAWLDSKKQSAQSYQNFRRVTHLLFEFAIARDYSSENPVSGVENADVRGGDVAIFTPKEIALLLNAATPEFLPCLAIGAFAGLRSAEIERLEWSKVDLAGRHITLDASKAKTGSRRVVPISDNLAAWLAPYAQRNGMVWQGLHDAYYDAQLATAGAAKVPWKTNALRHSYASYRFAVTGDAGRVAGELGNSAVVVHRHYKELVKPADAEKWFGVRPEAPANLVAMPREAATP